jgi:antitoxin HicB
MEQIYKIPLLLEPQPEGGYTITCPLLPELITEADTLAEIRPNVSDALAAVLEIYEDTGRPLPAFLGPVAATSDTLLYTETLVPVTA